MKKILKKIKKLKFYNKKVKGFTLIELMVVMAIIITLASFLLPKFLAYKQKAKDTKAITTAKQIHVAVMTDYSENNDEFNKETILDSIQNLIGVKGIENKNINIDDTKADVEYKSDGRDYKVHIDANSNLYEVFKDGNTKIFPKDNKLNE